MLSSPLHSQSTTCCKLKTLCTGLLFLYFLTRAASLYAQRDEITFEHLSLEEGLSDSVVTCILQDRKGLLWIGTENGLNRYDGYTFTRYKHDPKNPQSLSANEISAMQEDSQGVLWIGTKDGLQTYDWDTDQFVHYPYSPDNPNSLNNNEIQVIYEDQTGVLWIGTAEGLYVYNRMNKRFIRYHSNNTPEEDEDGTDEADETDKADEAGEIEEIEKAEDEDDEDEREIGEDHDSHDVVGESIDTIYQDRSGLLWFGTDEGLNIYDGQTFALYSNPDDPEPAPIALLYEDRLGNLWFATQDEGLLRCDQSAEHCLLYQHIPDDPGSLSHNDVNTLYEDQAGALWIGTLDGLNKFDRETEKFIRYQNDPANPHSLSYNEIGAIFEDRAGVLWIGTDGGGLDKYNRRTEHFLHYQHHPNNPQSLSHNRVQALYEDRFGNLWVGTEVGGLNRLDRDTEQFTHYRHDPDDPYSLSSDEVTALYEDHEGIFWVGTDEGGLDRFDKETGQFLHYFPEPENPDSLSHDIIIALYEDRSGIMWIGTEGGGLNRFNRTTEQFTSYQPDENDPKSLSGDEVWAIYEDSIGLLWIGTNEGLNVFDRETEEFIRYEADPDDPESLSHNAVWSIYEDHTGVLWIGTSGGLNKFNRADETFTHYTEQDGLPHEAIYGILEDEAFPVGNEASPVGEGGHLWLSTGKGLSRFNPNTETFKNYGINELQNTTFMRGASYKSRRGEMFFGGMHGFNAFYPQHITENPYPPQLVITDFQIFNRSVPIGVGPDGRSILEKSITETREIMLSYKDAVFSFEFAALDYTIPEKNQYAYMMEGFDKEWNEVGTRRVATYTNLPAGDYVFRVKGSNNDGVWNDEGIAIMLTIIPPFWETTWFKSVLIACALGAGYAVYTLRIWRLKKAQQRLEYEVQERTKELVEKNQQIRKQQAQLIESEKMAALGQLIAGIAHEINTPLGAIRASIGNISTALGETAQQLPQLLQQLSPEQQPDFFALVKRALQSKKQLTSREERKLRRMLREKLETYDIDDADDIADTLVDMGIYEDIAPFVNLLRQDNSDSILQTAYNLAIQQHNSNNIITALERVSKIVFALKSYAHYDNSSKMTPTNIAESIDVVLTLYHSQLQSITIRKTYQDVPSILCYSDQLHQVWTNLIHNAIQAMEGQGTLEIKVGIEQSTAGSDQHPVSSNDSIVVSITDSGCGIPPEIQPRIFEPFFTTKSAGEGSGLGLDIVRKIIDRHQGRIQVESQPGKTTFRVSLPIMSDTRT